MQLAADALGADLLPEEVAGVLDVAGLDGQQVGDLVLAQMVDGQQPYGAVAGLQYLFSSL
ncbi:hypothetical protein ACH4ZX_38060 [Streptomyces sp. NPDC020490]|uniref:hypothetical protein n=1 Tax=Streptomyces sp. NPDC020490 TaxID=3365078 RepID=UPI0037ACC9E6